MSNSPIAGSFISMSSTVDLMPRPFSTETCDARMDLVSPSSLMANLVLRDKASWGLISFAPPFDFDDDDEV